MAHNYATKEQRDQQVQEIIAMVKSRGRLTPAQAVVHFGLGDDAIRRRFEEACATGEVITHFKCGLFRDQKALADYLQERPRRLYGQMRAKAEAKALACHGNGIFDECRASEAMQRVLAVYGRASV